MKVLPTTFAFAAVAGKELFCQFDGGPITSDAGVLLLRQADEKLGLTRALVDAIRDPRDPRRIAHNLLEMLRERIYGIALGYPDNDELDRMRQDPALKIGCGRAPEGPVLPSQPTLCRLDNSVDARDLVRMGEAMARIEIERLPPRTSRVIVDVDPTDDPCHGQQEGEVYNAHYGEHCYLPLHVHITAEEPGNGDTRQRPLASVLRPGNASAQIGLYSTLRVIIRLLRERFPHIEITLRGDSGFGNCSVIEFCEAHGLEYTLGLASNSRLQELSTPLQIKAVLEYVWGGKQSNKPEGYREYGELQYQANTWAKPHRVIVKAEVTQERKKPTEQSSGGESPDGESEAELNPRYVVSSNERATPEEVYEFYCARGEQENGIKEMKLGLESGRTSCHAFLANQFRLMLAMAACLLMNVLQEAARGTEWEIAQAETLRTRLLKVGASIVETAGKICLHLARAYPEQAAWREMARRLGGVRFTSGYA